jgi:tetratricopeptide (TPR) repeat protein
MLRQFDKANNTVDRALALSPQSFELWEIKAGLAVLERGDITVAENALRELEKPGASPQNEQYVAFARAHVALLQRNYAEALKAAEQCADDLPESVPGIAIDKQMLIGWARKGLGDEQGARAAFATAKERIQARLNSLPDNAKLRGELALALAYLGEKDAALAEAQRARELLPESKDAFEGPAITEAAAQVYCIVGERARAIETLDGLLSRPSAVTVQMLKIHPIWDPLRSEPAFQQLLAKYSAKA